MEEASKNRGTHSVWINRDQSVLSFQKVKGFLEVRFPTHEEMFRFVVRLTESGCRIQ